MVCFWCVLPEGVGRGMEREKMKRAVMERFRRVVSGEAIGGGREVEFCRFQWEL